jgi:CelD/BcsL family acetyltransferase involved in cellulose biosynthesis
MTSCTIRSSPEAPAGWRELVRKTGSFYHEPAWIDGLARCFGMPAHYVSAQAGGELVGALPLLEVPALLGRRRLVSLPFSYAAGPISTEPAVVALLQGAGRELAVARRISRVEIKHLGPHPDLVPHFERLLSYSTYRVNTSDGPEAVFSRLHQSTVQRGIRRARKQGVSVARGESRDDWAEMARLQEHTSHGHGLPSPPRRFFQELCASLQASGLADLYLARVAGALAAGIVVWKGTREWIYAFGASVPRLLEHRPNHLLIWTAIEEAARAGVVFDLGRAAPSQHGLVEFKVRWGGVPHPLAYDYWPKAGGLNTQRRDAGPLDVAARVWRRLPFPIARRGSFLYRYLG